MTEFREWLEHKFTVTALVCVCYLGAVGAARRVYERLDELETRAAVRDAMLRHPAGRGLQAVPGA